MTPYLAGSDMAVSFVHPTLPDEPLIDVNDAFCRLSGYERTDCLLQNCRFLQGELTRSNERAAIRQGIKGDFYLITRLLNYAATADRSATCCRWVRCATPPATPASCSGCSGT